MEKSFEDAFMEVQEGMVSLCLELANNDVNKIYVYIYQGIGTRMFNAFLEKKIKY